jgi:O-antigen/teichoic acid export membrane protein
MVADLVADRQATGEAPPPTGRGLARFFGGRLQQGVAGVFALKVVYSGLLFLTGVLLTRALGPSAYGSYAYALTWATTLAVLAVCGLDRVLLRKVAANRVKREWGLLRGLLWQANRAGLLVSVALASAVALLVPHLLSDATMRATLWVGLALVPLLVLVRLREAALQGLDRVLTSQALDLFFQPLCLLALLATAAVAFKDWLTAPVAMGLCIVGSAASLAVGAYAVKKRLPPEVRAAAPEFRPLPWRDSLLPLFLATGMQMVFSQTPILLLGGLKGAEAVGLYNVANGGALLIVFALQAITPVLGPRVVSLHALGETRELQQILTKGVWTGLALGLPVAAGLIAAGDGYLKIFGPSFVAGRTTLVILSVGQVVSLAMGPTSWLLVLTGHERDVAAGVTLCTAVNVVLTAVLVPLSALEGAALAAAGSLVLYNLIMTAYVFKRLGINASALAWTPSLSRRETSREHFRA